MKARFLISAVLAFFVIVTSCKKDKVEEITQAAAMKAKVDGVDWVSSATIAGFDNATETLNIGGLSTGKGSINVIVTAAKVGEFTELSGATGSYVENNTKVWSTDIGGTASIKITKLDKAAKKVSGTFSFTAAGNAGADGNKTVTAGSFTDLQLNVE